jgi:hypothetical protein
MDRHEMSCPVCRAAQPWQAECRRCRADLTLYVQALESTAAARRLYQHARDTADSSRAAELLQYLRWLAPLEARAIAKPQETG